MMTMTRGGVFLEGVLRLLGRFRAFFLSPWGLAAQVLLGCFVTVFHAEVAGLFLFLGLFSALMALCDNLLATSASFLIASVFLAKMTDSYALFVPYWWVVFFPAGAMLFHFIFYRKPLRRGKAFWALLAVSVAITVGGLGAISPAEYFSGGALFHVGALGFGMLLTYVLLFSHVREDAGGKQLSAFFSNLMLAVGLFACFMVFQYYVEHLSLVIEKKELLTFQWRNNVSSVLMLTMPFPFYLALRRPGTLLAGLAMFLAILLTGSRGGLLFGTVELLMCLSFLCFNDKKRRWIYLSVCGLALLAGLLNIDKLIGFISPTLLRLLRIFFGREKEVREELYARAVQDFLRNPVFGVGIGYMGNRDIHASKEFALCWYHCAPLQIIGSMGIVGAVAYIYQGVVRCGIFLRQRSAFHLTLLLAWVAIEMMSLVNPGVFAPLPYLLLVTMFVVIAEKTSGAPRISALDLHAEKEKDTAMV
jgi:hypothetical protein